MLEKVHLVIVAVVFLPIFKTIEFEIQNKENETIWLGNQPIPGSEPFNDGELITLEPRKAAFLNTTQNWSGVFWARTHCNPSTGKCLTGHCSTLNCGDYEFFSTPYTIAAVLYEKGFYGYLISVNEGFNLPLSIRTVGDEHCKPISCKQRLNDDCPSEYRFDHENTTIGCHSACTLYKKESFCCLGSYVDSKICKSVALPEEFEEFFSSKCPDVSIFSVRESKVKCNPTKFIITFGI